MNYRMCATLRRCVFLYSQVSVAAASCQDWLIVSSQLIAPACVCTKSQKPREPGLVFLNLAIQRGRSLFRHVGILGSACHSTGCFFLNVLVT